MRVLVACEFSGTVRDAFIAGGFDAMSCDLLPSDTEGPHYQGDVMDILHDGWDLMVAHPPCTALANSGVRWLYKDGRSENGINPERWSEMRAGAKFYTTLRDAPIPMKCIENPRFHRYARELIGPTNRQVVQPHWFGDRTFKATGFELIGLPPLEPTDKLDPPKPGTQEHKDWSWVHRCPPGPDRWKIRSTTQPGIAKAMVAQWGKLLLAQAA